MIASVRRLERLVFVERVIDAPNRQRVNLGLLATEVARQLADMAAARGVDIRIDPQLPELVTNAGQLELVLMNLVTNSIKYSDPAKASRYVELALHQDHEPNAVTICVRDNGLGIPATLLGSVFKRFVRGHRDRDEELASMVSGWDSRSWRKAYRSWVGRSESSQWRARGQSSV